MRAISARTLGCQPEKFLPRNFFCLPAGGPGSRSCQLSCSRMPTKFEDPQRRRNRSIYGGVVLTEWLTCLTPLVPICCNGCRADAIRPSKSAVKSAATRRGEPVERHAVPRLSACRRARRCCCEAQRHAVNLLFHPTTRPRPTALRSAPSICCGQQAAQVWGVWNMTQGKP